nr:hypothetical protein CFP56_65591 [Quercus suber]
MKIYKGRFELNYYWLYCGTYTVQHTEGRNKELCFKIMTLFMFSKSESFTKSFSHNSFLCVFEENINTQSN